MIKIYEIAAERLQQMKNMLEAQDVISGELDVEIEKEQGKGNLEKAKSWKVNEFKRNGYILREAKILGIDKKVSYLYIEASEMFFRDNEKLLIEKGAKILEGSEYEQVKAKIQEAENAASAGIGFLFG